MIGRLSSFSTRVATPTKSTTMKCSARVQPVRSSVRARKLVANVTAFGPSSTAAPTGTPGVPRVKEEKEKGFINEMRIVAMKLHTREQAPKEGQVEAPKQQMWVPTREGYLAFLAESKAVYDVLETTVSLSSHPEYLPLKNTGLERSAALVQDIAWFESEYGMKAPTPTEDGPGLTYAKRVAELAESDPQAFVCHYYNFYFAHTAGGRMIGNKISEMLLDKKVLNFYQWDGDLQVSLDTVRLGINGLAETWSREQKDRCLQETSNSFKMSGLIMRCINQTSPAV